MNTLEYFMPNDLTRTLASDSHQQLTYYVKDNYIYTVLSNTAWIESAMWTQFLLRPKWICLICDTGNALPGVRYYTLSPGFWIPRECEVGWSKRFRANKVEHFDSNCQSMGMRSGPYTNTLLSQGVLDLGGELGAVDTITLEYHHKDEQHVYGRGLGLVRWRDRLGAETTFNVVLHNPCKMLSVCGRP